MKNKRTTPVFYANNERELVKIQKKYARVPNAEFKLKPRYFLFMNEAGYYLLKMFPNTGEAKKWALERKTTLLEYSEIDGKNRAILLEKNYYKSLGLCLAVHRIPAGRINNLKIKKDYKPKKE